MKRFIEGGDRSQITLMPECLDDYIAEDNPVRVVEVFVNELDLGELGFDGVDPAATGRPAYHPAVLLKIYIYGYLNRIQSSRRLEREAQRNIELMWLQSIVAIDGSKFKAVNNRDKNFTPHKLQARRQQLEESIARYLAELDRADREPTLVPASRVAQLKEKIAAVKAHVRKLGNIDKQLRRAPDQQVSLTDPDARSMATSGRGTGIVGYNVQAAVDTRHHMIVAHEVTNVGHDREQLSEMAKLARDAIGQKKMTALADRGYFKGEEILQCAQDGITTLVPKPLTSNSKADGRFDKRDFIYSARRDEYRCPAGERAIWRMTTVENGLTLHRYWSSACPQCPIKAQCTPSPYRRIARWEHEQVLDAMQHRLDRTPEASHYAGKRPSIPSVR